MLKAGVPRPHKTGRFLGGGEVEGWSGESNPLGGLHMGKKKCDIATLKVVEI